MQCPFLRELNVKYCGLCRLKMIPLNPDDPATDRCSGADYLSCPLAREHQNGLPPQDRCPYLCLRKVHYCAIAPVQKLIPCNHTSASRCTDDGHRYCSLHLAMAEPLSEEAATAAPGMTALPPTGRSDTPMPPALAFAPNHMWLDRNEKGTCHVGVDAFFARALGRLDAVTYPEQRDENRPAVRFRVGDVEFDLCFPNPLRGNEINAHLAVDPSVVLSDPYGRGWLFEGTSVAAAGDGSTHPLEAGLIRDDAARRWMQGECDRLTGFVHTQLESGHGRGGRLAADGGRARGNLVEVLDRRGLDRLAAEFFSLTGRRTGT